MAKQNYKIAEFRAAYDTLNWIHNDFTGHVEFERLRSDLRSRYAEAIAQVESMLPNLQKRYVRDLENATNAISRAKEQICNNEAAQLAAIAAEKEGEIFNPKTGQRLSLRARQQLQKAAQPANLIKVDFNNRCRA